ncbi:SDR family oxidoreductase [Dactylosporangium siamense]|uniref:SDR family oxidoreductase n=1 Tax=Dactylosporangium siamense TaxID=685454 RepID=UPI001EF2D600|nr:SDR family oxidoreductase [Dactylosporangium siamense]
MTGANGQIGGRVAAALPDARRLTRMDAEYRDTPGMRRALDGVETLLLVSGRESKDRVAEHRSAVDAAVGAGVRRIVYLSFAGAAPDCTFTFGRDHWHTEQHIRSTGLGWTFLRDNLYQEMLPKLAGPDGVIRGPAGDGRVAAVSHDDIAACAVEVLTNADTGRYEQQTYDLTGPEALTLHEVAARLGVGYEPETVEEAYASRAHYGAPAFEVAGWVSSYEAIAAGELAAVSGDVQRLTGRPAKPLQPLSPR